MAVKPDERVEGALFAPVKVGRASTAIVERIRDALASGDLREGDRLPSERELADVFGVSRVTVRDGLRALEASGLVQIRVGARGGAFVTAPSASHVQDGIANMLILSELPPDDVAEARLLLELGTITLAVDRATDEDVARLRELCERSQKALRDGTYAVALSTEFHALLAQAAHNPAIAMITSSFRGPLSMHSIRVRQPNDKDRHRASVREHFEILEALERRDAAAAREAMARHLLRKTTAGTRVAPLLERWADGQAPASRRRAK
jgi:DNA-binding FadR family transcriptional regulator